MEFARIPRVQGILANSTTEHYAERLVNEPNDVLPVVHILRVEFQKLFSRRSLSVNLRYQDGLAIRPTGNKEAADVAMGGIVSIEVEISPFDRIDGG